ncbi:hypothetical protein HNQ07_003868 [Deinococcus metalli]|uniref:Uncharacterized protein n=1 Tax=Deinococcus metalli TaxID=1141878 RepID=A0A7W8KHU2_9DEIO|nr:hypothetical protein [Deinococcus metalli]MBB5378362.1 hypothetical protein [Deinococcus metalli]GHF59450.1 hypothetical protein GCM10017781_39690 [Deinococcus metalli]
MMYTVNVLDETTARPRPEPALTLDFEVETVTVRDLIRRRVYDEVTEYNAGARERFRGLVVPEGMERALNSPTVPRPHRIDWEQQSARALEAFARGTVIVLVGDRQAETPDEPVTLRLGHPLDVTFIKLVPLVGG